MQQRPQRLDSQQAALPHFPSNSHGSGHSMPWLNQMGYGIPGLPHWPPALPETSSQRVASGILGWGSDGQPPWQQPQSAAAPPRQQSTAVEAADAQHQRRQGSWQQSHQQQPHGAWNQQQDDRWQHQQQQRRHSDGQQHSQQQGSQRRQQAGHSALQAAQSQDSPRVQRHQWSNGGQAGSVLRPANLPPPCSQQQHSPAGNGNMPPPPEPAHRSDTHVSARCDTGNAARLTGSSGSRPIRPKPHSFSGSLSAGGKGPRNLSAEEVSAAISREFGHSLADHNQEGSATSDEVHHPKLIPRAGAGPRLRQSGQEIDEYLMRLLRVGAANEAEARLYAQGKRTALKSQPPHQADDHRRNSDAASEKAAVQQLTAIVGAPPQPPFQQPQPPFQQPHQQQLQRQNQSQNQQQQPQQHQPGVPLSSMSPGAAPVAAAAAAGFLLPPRRPSSRQLALAPPPVATGSPAAPNSVGSQHAKVSSPKSRSAGNGFTGEDIADSAAARGARGAVSVTPSRGNTTSHRPQRGGSSGSDRPAISEWRGEARLTESAAGRGDGRGPLQPPRPPLRPWASAGAAAAPAPDVLQTHCQESPDNPGNPATADKQGQRQNRQEWQRGVAGGGEVGPLCQAELMSGLDRMPSAQQRFQSSGPPSVAALLSENLIGFRPPQIGSRANSGAGGEANSGDAQQQQEQHAVHSMAVPSAANVLVKASSDAVVPELPPAQLLHSVSEQNTRQQHPDAQVPAAARVRPPPAVSRAGDAMALLGWQRYNAVRDTLQGQAAEFRRQLSELHRLAAVQLQLAMAQPRQDPQHPHPMWPLPTMAAGRMGSQIPWISTPQVPGFHGMPIVPMISAWDPMAAWYPAQHPTAAAAAAGMPSGAYGMMPGLAPLQMPSCMAAVQPGLHPGLQPAGGMAAGGMAAAPAGLPPVNGGWVSPAPMPQPAVAHPAGAWFTPLQVQHFGAQPAGSATPTAYGGVMPGAMPMPAPGMAALVPAPGMLAGMVQMPYMAVAAGGAAGAGGQGLGGQGLGVQPVAAAALHPAFAMPPQWSHMQQQPQPDAQVALAPTAQAPAAAAGSNQAPRPDADQEREPKRQRLGR